MATPVSDESWRTDYKILTGKELSTGRQLWQAVLGDDSQAEQSTVECRSYAGQGLPVFLG